MKKAIIGYGHVGKAQHKLFPDAYIYDEPLQEGHITGSKEEVNKCDIAFVCVPTPMDEDGSANVTIVDHVVSWLETPTIVILSTIPPGTTDYLVNQREKNVVFQPEYIGETTDHPLLDKKDRKFLILGGFRPDLDKVVECYKEVYNSTVKIMKCTALEAEVIKYMENSFIATYVTFCNEFYNICNNYGIDYDKVREGFLLDPRMTPYWTFVYENNRGFGGHCLPKDLNAIAIDSECSGYDPEFLKDVIKNNKRIKNED
jgi:UDPglucose 6-dehydrogenase